MAESLQNGLVLATQVARDTPVRRSANGLSFATFGETGVTDLDLDRMLEAVPAPIVAALNANTYYFVPLALREKPEAMRQDLLAPAVVAGAWTDELSDAAICHRNVELGSGHRGVFISTRLMGDRFALSFEFFINVAHAFVDETGVPEPFAALVWQQALDNVRGETSFDAWESRHLALGRNPGNANDDRRPSRPMSGAAQRGIRAGAARAFTAAADPSPAASSSGTNQVFDKKEQNIFFESAFADAVAIYLLSLALDFDYGEIREREYPLLAPNALAARLRLVSELYPPNSGYDFAVRYRRRS